MGHKYGQNWGLLMICPLVCAHYVLWLTNLLLWSSSAPADATQCAVLTVPNLPPPQPSQLTPQISQLIPRQAKDHRFTTTTVNHLFRLSDSALELRYPLNCNGLIGWIYRGTACQLSLNGIGLNCMKMNSTCSHRLLEMSTWIDRGPRLPAEMGMYA